ncbi:hypothetical protein CLU79DRAFT_766425 [Phycomyces nitens]|nr:hypothetical protein CLU79DRAFT_766425 [Phycomyces nitens]
MEEGRHMFQIFAARMFEQRVLTAYREKVAQERQLCLLREEEEEQRQREERERKKQVERERKREQRRQLKQQQEAERLAKEAERKKEEAIAKAEAERILAEERRRREQERIRKEEERRQKEEARLRREEERRRRLKEEREKAAAERERKRKEKEEQDKRDLAEKKVRDQAERKRRALAEKARREAVAARKELEQREAREQEEEERLKSQNEIECLLNKAFDLPALAPTAICNSSSPALFNIGDETRHQVLMDTLVRSSSSLTQRGPMFGDYSLPAVSSRPVPNSLLFPVGHGVGIVGIDNSNPTPVFGVPMPLGYSSSRLLSSPKSSITPITTTTATTTTTTTTTTPTQISRHHPHPQITPIGQMPNGRRASSASTVGTVGTVGSPVIQRPPSQEAMMRPSSSTRAPTIKKRSAVLPDTPEDTHSLFSNFLFGEPSSRGNTSTLTMQPERTTRGQWIQDHMPLDRRFSNDSGLVWTNGWTASSVLSDNVHGKLFGDALVMLNSFGYKY